MGLSVLDVASDSRQDHGLYGVLDAASLSLPSGAAGVATRLTVKDAGGRTLLALVISREVRGRPEVRPSPLCGGGGRPRVVRRSFYDVFRDGLLVRVVFFAAFLRGAPVFVTRSRLVMPSCCIFR